MRTEPFTFAAAAGHTLSGRLDLPDGPVRAYALFAHCFTCTGNSLAAVRIARALAAHGIGVLRFDFTGLGESAGEFEDTTFSGNVDDLRAAAHAMQQRDIGPALLLGHSFGGAAVLAAAADIATVDAVATIAAPFDVDHIAGLFGKQLEEIRDSGEAEVSIGGRPIRIGRGFLDDLARHDQGERIAAIGKPLLVLHSPGDDIVGIDNAAAIFAAAAQPKSLLAIDGADHLLSRAADADYVAGLIAGWAGRYFEDAEAAAAAPHDIVRVEETGAGTYQVEVAVGDVRLLSDEPVDVGGLGSGPTPYELLSAALGACTVMTLRMYANHKKLPVTRIRATVGHCRQKGQVPPDLFTRTIDVEGEIDEQQRARLIEISERCPVHRTLHGGARIDTVRAEQADALAHPEPPERHVEDMQEACD